MTLASLDDSSVLKRKYNTVLEYKDAISRVKTAYLSASTALKADADYDTEASAAEKSDIDSDETAINGLSLT
jgi:hypothetical protein